MDNQEPRRLLVTLGPLPQSNGRYTIFGQLAESRAGILAAATAKTGSRAVRIEKIALLDYNPTRGGGVKLSPKTIFRLLGKPAIINAE